MERIAARDGVVFDGIADQRLQRERRQPPVEVARIDRDVEEEFVGIADLEQVTVRLGEFEFLAERHERALAVLDDVAERVGELVDVNERLVVLPLAHEHRQRVERVEEEMGVDLPDEQIVARGEILVLEPLVLHDDGLPLRDEHVDATVQQRDDHGERTFEQQHVVEHAAAHEVHHDPPGMPFRDGSHAV